MVLAASIIDSRGEKNHNSTTPPGRWEPAHHQTDRHPNLKVQHAMPPWPLGRIFLATLVPRLPSAISNAHATAQMLIY